MRAQKDRHVLAQLCQLSCGFLLLFVMSVTLLDMAIVNIVTAETAVPAPENGMITTLLEWWDKPKELIAQCTEIDMMSLKLAFNSASGPFTFLDSGDCWCPNWLLQPWCDELTIP